VQVDVERGEVDLVSGLLWSGGATAVQEIELGGERVRLVAGLDASDAARLTVRLRERWRPDEFDARYDGWLEAWRPFARPVRYGRVVVYPPWEPPPWPDLPPAPEQTIAGAAGAAGGGHDVLVALDAGRAFGQGNHATTGLMLEALTSALAGALGPGARRSNAIRPGASVLDVGCGSGVLAITAALLGAGRVVAIDVDDEAVRATGDNAARNGVSGLIEVSATPLDAVDGRYDLVLANILAPVLVELAPALVERVAPGGALLLSGLLASQAEQVLAAFSPPLTHAATADAESTDWRLLHLDRP
jgi:ribosomal protein L11 methyltransferase